MALISSVALSLIGFGISKYLGSGDLADATYSELGVGPLGDIFKSGSEKALAKIFKKTPDYNKNQLNHDLNKAARKSLLLATWYASRGVLLEYAADDSKKTEKEWIGKLADSLKAKIEKSLDEVSQCTLMESDVLAIFNENTNQAAIEAELISRLQKETYHIIQSDEVSFSLFNREGFELLKSNIETNWTEQANPTSPEKSYNWFSLVCGIFNDECKTSRIGFALQNKLFKNLLAKLEKQGESFDLLCKEIAELKQTTYRTEGKTEFLIDYTRDFRNEINIRFDKIEELLESDKNLTPEERKAKERELIDKYLEEQIKDYPIADVVGEIYSADKFFVDRVQEKQNLPEWLLSNEKIVVIKGISGNGKTALMTEVLRAIVTDENKITNEKIKGILTFYFRDFSGKVLDVNLLDICKKADARLAKNNQKFGFALQYEEFRKVNSSDIPTNIIANLCQALNSLGDIWVIFDNFESALQNGEIKDKEIEAFMIYALQTQPHLRFLITSQILPIIPNVANIRQCSIADLPADFAKEFLWQKGLALKENEVDCGLAEATDEQFDLLFTKLLPTPISLVSFAAYLETICETRGKGFEDVLADDSLFLSFRDFDAEDKNKGARVLIRRQFELLSEVEQLSLKALSIFTQAIEFPVLQAILPSTLEEEKLRMILKSNSLVRKAGRNLYELLPLPKEVISNQFEQSEELSDKAFNLKAAMFYSSVHKTVAECYTLKDFDTYFKEIEHYYQAGFYENIVLVINDLILKTNSLGMMKETLEISREIQDKLVNRSQVKAVNHVTIGLALWNSGKLDDSIIEYDKAIEIFDESVNKENRADLRNNLATAYLNKGNALWSSGKLTEAIFEYDRTIKIFEELVTKEHLAELRNELAMAYLYRGVALSSSGKLNEANVEYERAVEILEELVTKENRADLRNDLASAYVNKGVALSNSGKFNEAIVEYEGAIEILEELVNKQNRAELRNELAMAYLNKGNALWSSNKLKKAIVEYNEAIKIYKELVNKQNRAELRNDLSAAYLNKGNALWSSNELKKAIVEYNKAIEILEELVTKENRIELNNNLAMAYVNRGVVLGNLGKLSDSIMEYDKAIKIFDELVTKENRAELRNNLAMAYLNKGNALSSSGKLNEAIVEYEKAIEIREELVNKENHSELKNDLASAYMNKGFALWSLDKSNEAIGFYTDAIELWEEMLQGGYVYILLSLAKALGIRFDTYRKARNDDLAEKDMSRLHELLALTRQHKEIDHLGKYIQAEIDKRS